MRFKLHEMVFALATVCCLVTVNISSAGEEHSSELASVYEQFVSSAEQGTRSGWLPEVAEQHRAESTGEHGTRADAPAGTYPDAGTDEARAIESIRRAYTGRTLPDASSVYGGIVSETAAPHLQAKAGVDEKDEGGRIDGHACPPNVCKNGHCKMNYAIMISASWCVPCKSMYPVIKELRDEGYLIYIYVVDTNFPGLEDKFDVEAFPTFIVFENGKEVKRKVGATPASWFRRNLKTKAEQLKDLADDQTTNPEPVSPYDNL